jgi:hypothetical protein
MPDKTLSLSSCQPGRTLSLSSCQPGRTLSFSSCQPGKTLSLTLKVHKIEIFIGSEFEFYTISLLGMLKY